MINVFERLSPAYGRTLRQFAIDVWYGREDVDKLLWAADRYRRRYAQELMAHYRKVGYRFRPEQIRILSDEWLKDQLVLSEKLKTIAAQKKARLAGELDDLIAEKREEVRRLHDDARKVEGKVASVISFSTNLEDRAIQMGEQAAFDLGREINHSVVEGMGDVYRWTSQQDKRVRKTHRKLHGKLFSYKDPPTTIDEYGRQHTGNPGTDWGCRCWEEPAQGRPLRNYIARA